MSKKNKKGPETTIENYYDLKVDKVDDLVAALKGEDSNTADEINYAINVNTGVYDPKNVKRNGKEKQFDPYKRDFLNRIPAWVKAIFIKYWFFAAVCYFFMMGLKYQTELDSIIIVGGFMGMVVDILVNPIFRFMETDKREYNSFMMFPFPFKAFWTFFTNIVYYIFIVYVVYQLYYVLFLVTHSIGVEPLLFGVFTVIADMACIGIKDGIVALVRHIKNKKKENAVNA